MNVVTGVSGLRALRRKLSGTFGLVPTMGALHAGHLSLVARAKEENQFTGVSIFVNPAQFGPHEDLAAYPRSLDRDLELLASLEVDLVWAPAPGDVYPSGFQTWITVECVSARLE